jgi:hypothetical protein
MATDPAGSSGEYRCLSAQVFHTGKLATRRESNSKQTFCQKGNCGLSAAITGRMQQIACLSLHQAEPGLFESCLPHPKTKTQAKAEQTFEL